MLFNLKNIEVPLLLCFFFFLLQIEVLIDKVESEVRELIKKYGFLQKIISGKCDQVRASEHPSASVYGLYLPSKLWPVERGNVRNKLMDPAMGPR